MAYLTRAVDAQLDQLLPHAVAIAVEGPKGVGKTETARRRATNVLQLANVGATIMSDGRWCEPNPIEEIIDRDGIESVVAQIRARGEKI